ncbi:probable secreted peptidase [Streptomyces globisporus]|uniref:Probable secreted peptidase n=1 Tax=Streptomyces globisporus TaxID=1908 RepID=A0ABM9GZB2_STRGL|nr:probable secreted peptidase [Streptomyces globisporus]
MTVDGQKVTEQGGGRIDARAAVLGAVSATGTLAPPTVRCSRRPP